MRHCGKIDLVLYIRGNSFLPVSRKTKPCHRRRRAVCSTVHNKLKPQVFFRVRLFCNSTHVQMRRNSRKVRSLCNSIVHAFDIDITITVSRSALKFSTTTMNKDNVFFTHNGITSKVSCKLRSKSRSNKDRIHLSRVRSYAAVRCSMSCTYSTVNRHCISTPISTAKNLHNTGVHWRFVKIT